MITDYKNWDLNITMLDFVPAYTSIQGKVKVAGIKGSFRHGHPGVYLIAENNLLVYIGMAGTNVKKTLYRHFQAWDDSKRYLAKRVTPYAVSRVTYYDRLLKNDYLVSIIKTDSRADAYELEKRLLLFYQTRDNSLKLQYYALTHDRQVVNTKEVYADYEAESDWANYTVPPMKDEDLPF